MWKIEYFVHLFYWQLMVTNLTTDFFSWMFIFGNIIIRFLYLCGICRSYSSCQNCCDICRVVVLKTSESVEGQTQEFGVEFDTILSAILLIYYIVPPVQRISLLARLHILYEFHESDNSKYCSPRKKCLHIFFTKELEVR